VYRKKLTKEKIIRELEDNKGTQFDPEIADIMLRLLREGKITFEI
jgi:HD-GYP domain-containing protein (c-di-GMP phosphodiesterase class II)